MPTPTHPLPLDLLSGMAADERLFAAQLEALPQARVLPWLPPQPREALRTYAQRMAATLDPTAPCIVGGASFGGVVALEMAAHLNAQACVLIGSLRSPKGLSWRWRIWQPVACGGPKTIRVLAWLSSCCRLLPHRTRRQLRKLAHADNAFVRWAMGAVLRWRPSPATRQLRVFHIHGDRDRVLPVTRAQPDVIVMGGQHALTLFNADAVNAFLREVVAWSETEGNRCENHKPTRP